MRIPRLFAVGLALSLLLAATGALAQEPGARSIATAQVTVAATATQVAIARTGRLSVTIQNHGTTAAYCGASSSVTTATGFRLPGVDGASITIPTSATVYCIVAAATQAVSVLESY